MAVALSLAGRPGRTPRYGARCSAVRCAPSTDHSAGPPHGHKATRSAALLTISTLPPALRHPAIPATGSSPPPVTAAVQPTCRNTMALAPRPSAACIANRRASGELRRLNWALSAPGKVARGRNPTRLPQHRPCLTRLPPSPPHAGWKKMRVLEQAAFEAALLAKVGRPRSCLPPPAAGTASLPRPSRPAGCGLCIPVCTTAMLPMLPTRSNMPWAALPLTSGSLPSKPAARPSPVPCRSPPAPSHPPPAGQLWPLPAPHHQQPHHRRACGRCTG